MGVIADLPELAPVHEATSAEEREAIWEFRHRVYVEELGRKLGRADEDRPWVHDPEDDKPSTVHLYTRTDDDITGVLRIRHWPPGEIPAKDFETFSMERFPGIETLTTGEIGRLMVRRDERGTLLLVALVSAAYEVGVGRLEGDLVFMNCAPGLVRHYRLIGSRPYDGRLVPTPDGIEVPLVLVASDLGTMQEVGSFLLPLAQRYFGPGGRAPLDTAAFAHLFDTTPEEQLATAWARLEERVQAPESKGAGFLESLSPETRERLSAEGLVMSVPAGQLVTEKGLAQRELFLIVDGLFEAVDGERRLALMEEGDVIGETAFFSAEGRRSASVRALLDGRVVVLRRSLIDRLRTSDPSCAAELLFELARVQADRFVGLS